MKKICVCAHFAFGIDSFNGQTIKAKCVYNQLIKKYDKNCIYLIDTYNWKRHPLKLLINCIKMAKISDHIIILPAHRGFKVFIPLFNFLKKFYTFKLHYIVIGGWLYSRIYNNSYMKKELSKVDYIYLENHKVIDKIKLLGLDNLYQMNNFKDLSITKYIKKIDNSILKCCIFSRIEEKKGILNAISVINKLDKEFNDRIKLDIYGQVSNEFSTLFFNLIQDNNNISYKGIIDYDKSVDTIEKYDLMLFPTLYYTEGIPGTIIDSFFSGVPVLASKWENYDEILCDNVTGYSFAFHDDNDFYKKLKYIYTHKDQLLSFSDNCKKRAMIYSPPESMRVLLKNIGDEDAN